MARQDHLENAEHLNFSLRQKGASFDLQFRRPPAKTNRPYKEHEADDGNQRDGVKAQVGHSLTYEISRALFGN